MRVETRQRIDSIQHSLKVSKQLMDDMEGCPNWRPRRLWNGNRPSQTSGCIAQDNSRPLLNICNPDKARVFSTLKCIKNHIIF